MNSNFERELAQNGYLIYRNEGDSMLPLIKQNRDLMVIEKLNRSAKKYDAVLYKRDNGQYVMHRIIGSDSQGFILCGDNRYDKEYAVRNEQILGVLTAVVRDGKEIKTNSFKSRLYVHLWCDFFLVRRLILRIKRMLKYEKKNR